MKKLIIPILVLVFSLQLNLQCHAQIVNPGEVIKKRGEDEVNKKIYRGIDKLFSKKKKHKKHKKKDKKRNKKDETVKTNNEQQEPVLSWKKFDFVPGNEIIFEDNLENEENGEFPSRWDLQKGQVEVAELDGEAVIMFREGTPGIMPYFKSGIQDYLPDVFTVEFDLYVDRYPFMVYLFDLKHQQVNSPSHHTFFEIDNRRMTFGEVSSDLPDYDKNIDPLQKKWIHVSIAYTRGKLKGYIDETRLINIPRIDFDPKGITLHTDYADKDNYIYIKNIRIAKGGVDYYKRIISDGKIVSNGIRFDVNKATLRPESMGIINKIYKMLKKHPDLKLRIEGHTDSDGSDDFNMKLSEKRAESVKQVLVKMGIAEDRLTCKGMGETMPVADNGTPEGKATNRRVEFIKL